MNLVPQNRAWRGWTLHEHKSVGSTNDTARSLPLWHSVRAAQQNAARGRHGRTWESGLGGLWFSAVLPLDPPEANWSAFPLAAGLAVASVLRGLGLSATRLRWPNDVLIGSRKICGILMEKFQPDRMVVGIGLNISNHPATADPTLATTATSLSAELKHPPSADNLYEELLIALRALHGRIAEEGFSSLVMEINHHWDTTRRIELILPGETITGHFLGIDSRGDLQVDTGHQTLTCSAPHVTRLREL